MASKWNPADHPRKADGEFARKSTPGVRGTQRRVTNTWDGDPDRAHTNPVTGKRNLSYRDSYDLEAGKISGAEVLERLRSGRMDRDQAQQAMNKMVSAGNPDSEVIRRELFPPRSRRRLPAFSDTVARLEAKQREQGYLSGPDYDRLRAARGGAQQAARRASRASLRKG